MPPPLTSGASSKQLAPLLDDLDEDDPSRPPEYHQLIRSLSERSLDYLHQIQADDFSYQHLRCVPSAAHERAFERCCSAPTSIDTLFCLTCARLFLSLVNAQVEATLSATWASTQSCCGPACLMDSLTF